MTKPIKTVAIIGGGSAGLLSALTLKHFFPQLNITLFYSEKQLPIGVGESTTAWVPQFLHDCLKISHQEFYQAVHPVWKLGIRFEWGDSTIPYFNYPFDDQFRVESSLLQQPTGFYCLHDMRQASQFSILMDKWHVPIWLNEQRKMKIRLRGFGYHLDLEKFIDFLRQKISALGVMIKPIQIQGGKVDEAGNIETLYGEKGERIKADLFIDCSGFRSQLLNGLLQEKFTSYEHRLFCNSAVVGDLERDELYPIFPFTTVTTMPSGWRWRIDLKERISFGYVYSSQFSSQEEATLNFLKTTPQEIKNLRKITFKSGRYQRFWVNNVVAIGNASGFVEPLESTGQHMITETLWRLVLALQESHLSPSPLLKEATNQYITSQWDEICDFLALHFKFNHKLKTPFWSFCHAQTTLGKIENLVALYQECGIARIMSHLIPQSSLFDLDGYLNLLCGQNLSIKNKRELSQEEKTEWETYRNHLQREMKFSLSPEQAFEFLNDEVFS